MNKKILGMTVIFLTSTLGVFAQQNDANNTVTEETKQEAKKEGEPEQAKFKARIYANYEAQLSAKKKGETVNKGELTNQFEIERVYLRYTNYLNKNTKVHATTDVGREDFNNDGKKDKLGVYLKYAYAQYGAVKKDDQKGSFAWLIQGGMFATPWIGTSDHFRKYRFLTKTGIDDAKLDSSSDLGVGGKLFFADKLVTLEASITNGEGYKHPETNNYKKGRGLLGFHPAFGSVKTSFFVYGQYNQTDVKDTDQLVGPAFQLTAGILKVQLSYFLTEDKVGGVSTKGNFMSAFLSVALKDLIGAPFEIFGQFNRKDKSSKSNDEESKLIAGINYRPIKQVALAVDFQQKEDTAVKKNSEQAVFVHSEFNF